MHIIAKSQILIPNILGKAKICKDIELQLFDEFDNFNDCVDDLYQTVINIPDINIRCVHSPLESGEDVNIEFLENEKDFFKLSKTVELAGRLSDYYNETIKIIMHSSFNYENYKKIPSLLKRIEDFVEKSLDKYKNIIICIENVIPCKFSKEKELFFRNGCLFDNIKLVKHLRTKLNTNRIGTVLDTCHMMITLQTLDNIFKDNYIDYIKEFDMEKFFIENKDYIQLIHLCDVKNLGYNKKEHGIKFESDRLYLMSNLIDLYLEYNYRCDITIEIIEDDYVINNNFKENYEILKTMLKNNYIL